VLADSGAVRSITSTEPSRIASVRAFSTAMMLLRATGYGLPNGPAICRSSGSVLLLNVVAQDRDRRAALAAADL
jgi:hypothetical protein